MEKVGFSYKKRKIVLEVKECSSLWSKFMGLMFRTKNTAPLIFIFNKPTKTPIHSLFCQEFIAVWLDDKNRVVGVKKVKSWRWSVKPKKKFVNLVEIPINKRYRRMIKFLVDDAKGF